MGIDLAFIGTSIGFGGVAGFLIGVGVIILVANFVFSWLRGPRVTGDPWP